MFVPAIKQIKEDAGLSITACQFTIWTARCGDHYNTQPVDSGE